MEEVMIRPVDHGDPDIGLAEGRRRPKPGEAGPDDNDSGNLTRPLGGDSVQRMAHLLAPSGDRSVETTTPDRGPGTEPAQGGDRINRDFPDKRRRGYPGARPALLHPDYKRRIHLSRKNLTARQEKP